MIKSVLKSLVVAVMITVSIFQLTTFSSQALTLSDSAIEQQVLQAIKDHPDAILEAIDDYQQQQYEKEQSERKEWLKKVASNPAKFISQSPASGALEDHSILIEFSDFQCPYCAKAHSELSAFVDQHKDNVTLIYKNYPLEMHAEALPAAKAAWAAQQQNRFWEYHDALFEQQAQLSEDLYVAIAQKLNLNLEQFNQDRNSAKAEAAVASDIQLADQLGLDGTPYFVMGDQGISGLPVASELEKLLLHS